MLSTGPDPPHAMLPLLRRKNLIAAAMTRSTVMAALAALVLVLLFFSLAYGSGPASLWPPSPRSAPQQQAPQRAVKNGGAQQPLAAQQVVQPVVPDPVTVTVTATATAQALTVTAPGSTVTAPGATHTVVAGDSSGASSGSPANGYLRDATQTNGFIATPDDRVVDTIDSFANFTRTFSCDGSSLELHEPFHPLCQTREQVLTAMTSGGRRGVDAPYAPRGCDMRWYTSDEVCEIMSRFDQINIIGDSMMRNLAAAMHVYLRRDLYEGAHADWNPDPAFLDCHCHGVFNSHDCLFNSALSTVALNEARPGTIKCGKHKPAFVEYHALFDYPPAENLVQSFEGKLPPFKPFRPHVFLMGHGIWNDLNESVTQEWTEKVETTAKKRNPWLAEKDAFFPRLFITPSAAGQKKPDQHIVLQGNKALVRFEQNIGAWVKTRGIEHLGMWNATVQGDSPDGTHAGMHSNLLKAMMVFNWLDKLDVPPPLAGADAAIAAGAAGSGPNAGAAAGAGAAPPAAAAAPGAGAAGAAAPGGLPAAAAGGGAASHAGHPEIPGPGALPAAAAAAADDPAAAALVAAAGKANAAPAHKGHPQRLSNE